MSYFLRNGKMIRQVKVKRPKSVREPIKPPYMRELFNPGPVRDMAHAIAKQQLFNKIRAEGKDPRLASAGEIENGITILFFNAGEYFLNKAKEALR